MKSEGGNGWRHGTALWVAGVCALLTLAYGQYLNLPLYADDYRWLRWAKDLMVDPATLLIPEAAMFRFILKILYAPLWLLCGSTPAPYHLVDLALLWASVGLALRLYRQLGLGLAAAGMATLLHALHPAHPGAFLICGSTTGLLGWVLYLLAAIFYLGFRARGRMRDWWGAFACFAIGLGVKEDLMTLPALLILHDLLLRREENWRATVAGIVRRLAPFIALLLVVLLAQWSVQRLTYMVGGGNYAPKFIPGNYAKMTVAQINPWWRQAPAKYLDLALYALVLTGLVRGDRRLRYFLLWIFVTYLPFALLDWGHEDRFFLIPSFGLGGLFGLAVERLLAHGRRRSVVLAALAVIALGFAGINRGPLTAWYTTEAWRTASFVKTVRKATRPGQHFQLVYDPVTNPETKFIDPTFVLPIEFGDGRHADRLPAPACDEKLVRLAWHGGGFRVMQPAAGKPDADVPGKSFPLR